jgi:hypothetical protein
MESSFLKFLEICIVLIYNVISFSEFCSAPLWLVNISSFVIMAFILVLFEEISNGINFEKGQTSIHFLKLNLKRIRKE